MRMVSARSLNSTGGSLWEQTSYQPILRGLFSIKHTVITNERIYLAVRSDCRTLDRTDTEHCPESVRTNPDSTGLEGRDCPWLQHFSDVAPCRGPTVIDQGSEGEESEKDDVRQPGTGPTESSRRERHLPRTPAAHGHPRKSNRINVKTVRLSMTRPTAWTRSPL